MLFRSEVKGLELEATVSKLQASDGNIGDLTTQLSTLSQKNEDLVDKVDRLTATLEAKEHDLDVTRGELHNTTTALEQARFDAKEQEKETLENNTVMEGRISALTNALELSQGELRASEDKVLTLNTQLTEKDAALETLVQTHQTETAVLENRISLLTTDLKSKNRDLDTSQREVRASNEIGRAHV